LEEYRTSDLWLTSYLLIKGENLIKFDKDRINPDRFIFIFKGENLENKAQAYYENGEIPALSFKSMALNLKHKIYERMKGTNSNENFSVME